MQEQERVAAFIDEHGLGAPPVYRLLDVVSELGEVAKEVNESTGYGDDPAAVAVSRDEIGDALFALLALADTVDVDADEALEAALAKYETRLQEKGSADSGR